jgi:Tfp pilus assembly protein PilX
MDLHVLPHVKARARRHGAYRFLARRAEQGAALVIAMFVLIALLIIGVSAARTALFAEKAARAERDRHIALQSAEAALADAEHDIEGGNNPDSGRAGLFAAGNADGFVDGCGNVHAVNAGLCMLTSAPLMPAWQRADLALADADATSTPYGAFTGASMAVGHGALPARLPRYIIELMPFAGAGENASVRTGNFYRITAIGFGMSERTRVVVQALYLKPAPEGDPL